MQVQPFLRTLRCKKKNIIFGFYSYFSYFLVFIGTLNSSLLLPNHMYYLICITVLDHIQVVECNYKYQVGIIASNTSITSVLSNVNNIQVIQMILIIHRRWDQITIVDRKITNKQKVDNIIYMVFLVNYVDFYDNLVFDIKYTYIYLPKRNNSTAVVGIKLLCVRFFSIQCQRNIRPFYTVGGGAFFGDGPGEFYRKLDSLQEIQ